MRKKGTAKLKNNAMFDDFHYFSIFSFCSAFSPITFNFCIPSTSTAPITKNRMLNVDMESLSAEEQMKMASIGTDTYQAAQLFIAALPMLCIYPFMQKYFTKGLVMGSVKG